jgi:hypothetical protein
VIWLFLAAFSQAYSKNWEQKLEQKALENLQFGQKSLCKVGAMEGIVSKRLGPLKRSQALSIRTVGECLEDVSEISKIHPLNLGRRGEE